MPEATLGAGCAVLACAAGLCWVRAGAGAGAGAGAVWVRVRPQPLPGVLWGVGGRIRLRELGYSIAISICGWARSKSTVVNTFPQRRARPVCGVRGVVCAWCVWCGVCVGGGLRGVPARSCHTRAARAVHLAEHLQREVKSIR